MPAESDQRAAAMTPLAGYLSRVAAGQLKGDPAQEHAAERLEQLWHALASYEPSVGRNGWRARLGFAQPPDPVPRGLYLFGAVGRGKSMLMDAFFETAPLDRKRRVHFHGFMLDIHERLHQRRQLRAEQDPIGANETIARPRRG